MQYFLYSSFWEFASFYLPNIGLDFLRRSSTWSTTNWMKCFGLRSAFFLLCLQFCASSENTLTILRSSTSLVGITLSAFVTGIRSD